MRKLKKAIGIALLAGLLISPYVFVAIMDGFKMAFALFISTVIALIILFTALKLITNNSDETE
jgi:hypothetical protein